jgi:hypothetical protein
MYTLINDGIKKCLITVVLNFQNFGKCLSFNVMCMTEIENRDSLTDKQTMGDELNETGTQTRKLRNGQMDNANI